MGPNSESGLGCVRTRGTSPNSAVGLGDRYLSPPSWTANCENPISSATLLDAMPKILGQRHRERLLAKAMGDLYREFRTPFRSGRVELKCADSDV